METESEIDDINSLKRKKIEESSENQVIDDLKSKKRRVFSAKEFRKQLNSTQKLNALREFLSVINNSSGHDYVYDYLKNGGSCLELLQTLENDSSIPPTVIFDLVTQLLLRINANYGQYFSSAHESCRYLLNNYLPLIHKMLGLSSSKEERKACLKLLTAMVAFSQNLAKDILLKVKFHSANIELLTKHTGEANSVRDCFIHFLTAFLVDGDLHTLSILLERSGLLTGIISGLQYDIADTVCIVVTAMKNHILENNSVTKTTKMHVFNTPVVKDIVNLYNWKGPEGLKALEKNNKTVYEVDKIAKSKVSECVHDFLLILCTSHKHGVIFRDPLVGLGKKNQNGLMYTVLDSLDRPWEHSYASELVIKICRSCPDLTKNLWSILKPFLEPRSTEKWTNAMNFARKLIKEMEPLCLEYCAKDLNPYQMAQIIEFLVSPSPIIKTLTGENSNEQTYDIRNHILLLLHDMLEKINTYLQALKTWTGLASCNTIKHFLTVYINKNYPNSQNLLEDWRNVYSEENLNSNKFSYLQTILSILSMYKNISPQLLQNLTTSGLDLKELLLKLSLISEIEIDSLEMLQVKIIDIFVDIDISYFLPKTEIFAYAVPLLFRMYHQKHSKEIQEVLYKLFKNSGLFENSLYEINIWLNGIFSIKNVQENIAENMVLIIRNTAENASKYQKELSQIQVEDQIKEKKDFIMDILLDNSDNEEILQKLSHRLCSPLVIGFLKFYKEDYIPKSIKKYSEFVLFNLFHYQTSPQKYMDVIKAYNEQLSSSLLDYIQKWEKGVCEPIEKTKGIIEVFKSVGETFLRGHLNDSILKDNLYPDFLTDILQMCTFYFSNLSQFGSVTENHSRNLIFLITLLNGENKLDNVCLETILGNPNLINYFNIIELGKSNSEAVTTQAFVSIIQELQKKNNIDFYVKIYSEKVFKSLLKALKKPKKYLNNENFSKLLEIFPLSYNGCIKVITQISEVLFKNLTDSSIILDILTYCIDRVIFLCKTNANLKPLDKELITRISSCMVDLNKDSLTSGSLFKVFEKYLGLFPHNVEDLDNNLFSSILQYKEYDKDGANLAIFLLERNLKLMEDVQLNIENIVEKKGVVLPLVHILVNNSDTSEKILSEIYERLEKSILKAMQKPQKVGQHFLKNYDINVLVKKFMSFDKCRTFTNKVHKFEIAEVFHANLLMACFSRVLEDNEVGEKEIGNMILTLVHIMCTCMKKKGSDSEDTIKLTELSKIFNGLLEKIHLKSLEGNLSQVSNNETFKTFCKFALKFGISGQHSLLIILRSLIIILTSSLQKDDIRLLMEMLMSHSEFLNVVLGDRSDTKLEVLKLLLTICQNWPDLMEKSHLAVVLSAYRGMVTRCDRTVLALLKEYESKAEQTRFYDFKPFLWGRAAAIHYSVRSGIESSLINHPTTSDVLGIIKEDLVNSTITNYPLNESLHQKGDSLEEDYNCYDLKFLLPLFSHILAPEQQVKTYLFSRSGALSLTVVGLSSQDKEVRQASCHVLSRFHFHLEARQTGKDNLLWIRFVEALCKGAAVLPNFTLNNFVSIFYARMALILTNPKHVMYTSLSSYLTAKQDLDLSTVPELYTLLFSSDVNYKEHRSFILEILRDGLRSDKDCVDLLKSMAPKLFMELFSSCISDKDSKTLILEILEDILKLPIGVKILSENYSLLSYLQTLILDDKNKNVLQVILPKFVSIFLRIVEVRHDSYSNNLIYDNMKEMLVNRSFFLLKGPDVECYYQVLYIIFENKNGDLKDVHLFLKLLLEKANDSFCNYIMSYGCKYITENSTDLQTGSQNYFLRLLIYKYLLKKG